MASAALETMSRIACGDPSGDHRCLKASAACETCAISRRISGARDCRSIFAVSAVPRDRVAGPVRLYASARRSLSVAALRSTMALKQWDALLQQGRAITAIGSSDSHQPPYEPSTYPTNLRIGNPTVFVGAPALNQKSLLAAIKKGRVFVTEKPIEFDAKFRVSFIPDCDLESCTGARESIDYVKCVLVY